VRVLQVIPSLGVGGAERVVALLARHLRAGGHHVEVAALYGPRGSWIEADLRAAGIPLHFLEKRPGLDLRMIPRLRRVLAEAGPDLVHTHMYVLKYMLPALATAGRRPVIHTVHNLAPHEVEWPSRLLQGIAFRAGVVPVAIGEAVAESMRLVYRLRPRHVIPNGIPVASYAPPPGAREEVRGELGIPGGAPVFVSVGSFKAQKNTAALIEAMASPRLRDAGAHLLLAGDGALRDLLQRGAAGPAVAGRVHLLGIRGDVPRILAASDAFVLASRYEGNPLVVMEAMAAGKPVVATAVGCVPELVLEGTGRLVPAGDGGALEEALVELARDPVLALRRGAAAARVAATRFDASVMAEAYARLYGDLTRRRPLTDR
jgi:glycosyltransferase involved in cell wall biosynthesis